MNILYMMHFPKLKLCRFRIDKDDVEKVFKIDLGIKCEAGNIDKDLLNGFKVPIPVCNGNFSLQGNLIVKSVRKRIFC